MKGRWLRIGGLFSAFLSSVCCIGPTFFAALGIGTGAIGLLGGLSRFAASMVPFRPFFILLTFVFLGVEFYSVYRRVNTCETAGCSPEASKKIKMLLWAVAGLSLVLMIAPYLLPF